MGRSGLLAWRRIAKLVGLGLRPCAAVQLAFALLVAPAHAGEAKLPAPRYALFVGRLLAYDANLLHRAGKSVDVAVLYKSGDAASTTEAEEMTRAMKAIELTTILDLPVKTCSVAVSDEATLEKAVLSRGIDAFLVLGGLEEQTALIKRVSEARKVITLGSTRAQVQAGLSVSVYLEDDKSKILVSLSASRKEGAAFSSDLLRLSEVIP